MSQNATTSNGASDFVNSLGVSTKSSDYIDAYKNASLVINALDYLNITLVRDSYSQYGQGKEVVDALAAAGIRTDLVVEDYVVSGGEAGLDAYIAALKAFVAEHPGSLIAVEGPNEVNSATFTYNGLTSTEAITAFQRDLYTAIKSDPELSSVVVYNTSVADNSATYSTLGDLGAYSDAANVHAYPNTGRSPDAQMEAAFARAQSAATGDPIVVTETGYSTLSSANGIGTNEDAQAKLILQNMLDAYEDGAGQIYLYELLDTPTLGTGDKPQEASFGLFNADGTPKLAATAIHNLTTILSFGNDGSASTAQDTEFTLTGAPASTHSMVLTKSGDVYDIVVWSDVTVWDDVNDKEIVNPTTTVTVNLGETVTSVRIYDPLNGLTPIATYTNVSSFTIPVSDHPLVIEVGASAAAQETTTTVDSQLTLTSAEFVAQMDKLAQADGLTAVTLTDSHVLDLASVETMQYVTANYGDLLAKIDGGVTFSVSYGQASWRTELLFDANGIQTDRIEYNINNGAVTAKTDYHQDGTIEYYNYVIAGQTYTSQHQVADATGKIVLIERFHADGTLDYIKAVSSDSTQQITTYNAAGQKLSDITIAPDGARTTDSYDPSTGNIIQEIVDSSTEYTTRSYMDGVLTKVISTSKVTGYTDHYLYYVIGQTYTTQHQLIDANGKIWLIERFHADGTLDYTKTISADGTQDTVIYNAAGQKVSEIIIAPNGDRTTDTFDPTDGGLIQETVDTGASSTTDYFINGLLIKTVSINKIENVSDYYYYGITGQAYTSQHQQVDAAGRITLIERWHADGTLDYTKTVAADGTQDTVTYNSVGQKILEVVVSSDGTTTTDTYDSSTGNIIQEIVDSSATYTTRIYTNGVLTKLSTLTKSTGYTDTFTYNITGQTYTSQHVVTDSSGKIWLTERFHADGTLDYTKSVSADGAQDTVTYNAAGQKVGEVLVSSNGTTTTDTFDPSTGKLTQETVDTSATSTTKYWTDGVLMKMVALNLATNVSDFYYYNISGQTYTSQHQQVDATGKITLIERWHADGTLDYTKTFAADGTQDTVTYNSEGNKISEVIISSSGVTTTDTYDPSTGKITLEVVDSYINNTTRNYTGGVLMKVTTLTKATGYADVYTYNIVGQTYTSQHIVTDSSGKVWLTERFHADGTRDYTKAISADGTQDTVTYNAAGQKVSEVIIAPNGDKTTDTFDAASGKLTQATVDTSTTSTTKYWTDGVLMKTVAINKASGLTDYYYYNISGQTYTTQHQQVDSAGKITLIERWHADGTLDYTKTIASDGTTDTVTYNSAGKKITDVIVAPDGTKTTDTFDASTGKIMLEVVDSSTAYTTRNYASGVLTKVTTLNKVTGYTDTYTYNIAGQTYSSQHIVTDSTGKVWLTERWHADGTLDYTKTVAADGATDTLTYNTAGQKVSEIIVAANGDKTTNTFDAASGKLTQATVDTSATSTTKYWTDGVLMKVVAFAKTTGTTDYYNYNISGQSYTTQHQQVDSAGKITMIERWHADGTLDYTKTIAANGATDTVTYNSAGKKIGEVIVASDGTKTTDTYDAATGFVTQEIVDSSTLYTTRTYAAGALTKVTTLTKSTGYTDTYTYSITGQTYTTQHQVADSSGKIWLTERWHADGTLDYTKSVAADGSTDTVTYNSVGKKIGEVIVASDGTKTTDTYDAATGLVTQEIVDSSTQYTTRTYAAGALTKVTTLTKSTGYTDTYTYSITGQTYTTQHQVADSSGKIWLTERWHADGTLDYTKSVAADGSTDTVTYNTVGQKVSEVFVAANGDKTTDTFDATSGTLTQETVDTSTTSTTKYWTDSVLMKTVALDKAAGSTDYYNYNITGQTYTSQHQQIDSTGKITLIERWHSDGTLDYREIPHSDGSKDTWMYDSKGTLLAHYDINVDGSRVVDNYLQDGTGDIRHDTFSKDMVLLLRDYEHSDGTHTVYSYTAGQTIYGGSENDIIYLRNMADNTFHYDGGTDTVVSFNTSSDHISIDQTLAASASDLQLAQTGSDVTVTIDASHAIILKDMQLASVSTSIFVFE